VPYAIFTLVLFLAASVACAAPDYAARAREVSEYMQATLYRPEDGLYAVKTTDRKPDFMWGNGITFSALLIARRHHADEFGPVADRFYTALDRYWDALAPIPGYEPAPTAGRGNDKYYDDNAWLVLNLVEAYEVTGDEKYLRRAKETLAFVLSGWDDTIGGGIWWHEGSKDGSKNTCSNAPTAVACLRLARHVPPDNAKGYIDQARRIVDWTARTFETPDGLYMDSIVVATGELRRGQLTYNTALMIRAFQSLHLATGERVWLDRAVRSSDASDWFLDDQPIRAYRDAPKWSHLLVEADLELYRETGNPKLLRRAMDNADRMYEAFKKKPPEETLDTAAIARTLWLMADHFDEDGKAFWKKADGR
jgi:hypothetical protein